VNWEDAKFWVISFGGLFGFIIIIFGAIGLLANAFTKYQCEEYSAITGKNTRYVQFDSCYIKTPDGYQRWSEYKARATASEGLKGLK